MVLNKNDYINEGLRQLNDQNFYRKISRDLTSKTTTEIQKFLQFIKERKLLSDSHIAFLNTKNPRTPIFYMLPKIHKPNNPGRLIVSACDSPTE